MNIKSTSRTSIQWRKISDGLIYQHTKILSSARFGFKFNINFMRGVNLEPQLVIEKYKGLT